MSPAIPKQFESFAQKLSAQSRLIQPSDGWGLRLFWIGSSPERAAIIALGERDFDAALAKLFGMPQGSTTAPWAHGATASGFLARACLRASGIDFSEVDAWGGSASENCHSHSRRFNSARFFVVDPGQEAPAIQALTARLPGSWVYSRDGIDLLDAEPASTPARLPQLPPYFSLNGSPPEVQVQIDGRGRAHWMWLPAAARALGAPTPISISGHGAADFLAWGDILSAANRRASEDPDGFARDFAQALLPWEAPAPGLSNMGMRYDAAPSSVIHHFVAADRCCVEEHAIDSQTLPGQDSRPSPRL